MVEIAPAPDRLKMYADESFDEQRVAAVASQPA